MKVRCTEHATSPFVVGPLMIRKRVRQLPPAAQWAEEPACGCQAAPRLLALPLVLPLGTATHRQHPNFWPCLQTMTLASTKRSCLGRTTTSLFWCLSPHLRRRPCGCR